MVLMGGPIDTAEVRSAAVNKLAETRGIDWFRRNVIKVPFPNPGFCAMSIRASCNCTAS